MQDGWMSHAPTARLTGELGLQAKWGLTCDKGDEKVGITAIPDSMLDALICTPHTCIRGQQTEAILSHGQAGPDSLDGDTIVLCHSQRIF